MDRRYDIIHMYNGVKWKRNTRASFQRVNIKKYVDS